MISQACAVRAEALQIGLVWQGACGDTPFSCRPSPIYNTVSPFFPFPLILSLFSLSFPFRRIAMSFLMLHLFSSSLSFSPFRSLDCLVSVDLRVQLVTLCMQPRSSPLVFLPSLQQLRLCSAHLETRSTPQLLLDAGIVAIIMASYMQLMCRSTVGDPLCEPCRSLSFAQLSLSISWLFSWLNLSPFSLMETEVTACYDNICCLRP